VSVLGDIELEELLNTFEKQVPALTSREPACVLDGLVQQLGHESSREVVDRVGCTQPQASKHLRVLRDVGLVRCRAEGRRRVYRVNADGLAPLRTWLDELTESINAHYDRLDDYLDKLQHQED
jgi:DNA-binding transcriptional ArsR family regulator